MFSFFKKKKHKQPNETSHIIFSLSKSGKTTVTVLPRNSVSEADEDLVGQELFTLHNLLSNGQLKEMVIEATYLSRLHPIFKNKLAKSIENSNANEVVRPRNVFPNI